MDYTGDMKKSQAITLLGGTPADAARAMRYRSVHAIYMWPDTLSDQVSDRVRGAAARLDAAKNKSSRSKTSTRK